MKLSITLPSIFPPLLRRTIDSIYQNTYGVDYEILVMSPFEVHGPFIKWIPEITSTGNCSAHARCFTASSGDIIVALSDDVVVTPFWANALLHFYLARERELSGRPLVMGHRFNGTIGTVFGMYYAYFPVMSRTTVDTIGGYYSEEFRARFGDPDIGMRCWEAGGVNEILPTSPLINPQKLDATESPDKKRALRQDMKTFLGKWAAKYGKGWNIEHLRDFNFDLQEDSLHFLPEPIKSQIANDRTVRFNNPTFKRIFVENLRIKHSQFDIEEYLKPA